MLRVTNGNSNLPKTYLSTFLCDSSDSSEVGTVVTVVTIVIVVTKIFLSHRIFSFFNQTFFSPTKIFMRKTLFIVNFFHPIFFLPKASFS